MDIDIHIDIGVNIHIDINIVIDIKIDLTLKNSLKISLTPGAESTQQITPHRRKLMPTNMLNSNTPS